MLSSSAQEVYSFTSPSLHPCPSLNARQGKRINMDGAGGSACDCRPTRGSVLCSCGALTCPDCGAVQQPARIIDRLNMVFGYYFGTSIQNPLCENCLARPETHRRRRTRQPEQRPTRNEDQGYEPPPNILSQPGVVHPQVVQGSGPLLTRARQLREQQRQEEGEETGSTLGQASRLRARHLASHTRESGGNPNRTNQGTDPSSISESQSSPRSSGEETVRPTRATGERPAQGHERPRTHSTGVRQPMAHQPEREQPDQLTREERERERERLERMLRRLEEERQRDRERGRERRREEFQRRREAVLRTQQVQLLIQSRLRGILMPRRDSQEDQQRRESIARYRLLLVLTQRQRHERQRRGHQSQSTTTTKGNKPTKETSKQCVICVETYTNVEDSFPFPPTLRQCSAHHDMDVCVICLCTNIKSQIESRGSAACEDLKCPNLGCDHVYTYKQVRLLADPETFALYDRHCLNANLAKQANFRRCLRGRCTNGQIYDELDSGSPYGNRISCNECGFVMCFKHHCPWHQDLTCDEYELQKKDNDQETERWLAEKTKPCPNCSIPIEKGNGCFHMTCRGCRFEFCWECLADWRIAGSGRRGHRPDCFFRMRAAPPPTVMLGSTIVEAQRNRERAAQFRAQFDGLLER